MKTTSLLSSFAGLLFTHENAGRILSCPKQRKNRKTRRLQFDRLEPRNMMAADAEIVSGILEIEGTEAADVISIDRVMVSKANTPYLQIQYRTQVTIRDRATNELLLQERFNLAAANSIYVASFGGDDLVYNNTNLPSELYGGADHDALYGGGGRDRLHGAGGDDDLYGRGGDDDLFGYNGNDDLFGGDGNDLLQGDSGYDELFGEAGNDTLIGGSHDDDLYGGDGNDFMWGDEELFEGSTDGDDYMEGGDGDDFMAGRGGNDIIKGNDGDDTLNGGSGDDDLFGGADEDIMQGGPGSDDFETGTGIDDVYFGVDDWLEGRPAFLYVWVSSNVNEGPYQGSYYWTL